MTPSNIPTGWKANDVQGTIGIACNNDPLLGGIIDTNMVSGLWFVIFNDDDLEMVEGLQSREEAFKVFEQTINNKYITE